jgi:peptide/nickel transport system substrate-binding protein
MRSLVKLSVTAAVAAAATAAVCLATASASGTRTAVSPQLNVGVSGVMGGTLDDTKDSTFTGEGIAMLGLESLTVYSPNGKIRPWLAQSVQQPGRDIYVYHLRHGIKFWDGTELTSDDVANALNYERDPTSMVHSFGFPSVKTVTAPDRYTVIVTLRHPDPNWLAVSSESGWEYIFEKKFQQQHKLTFGQPGTLVMGTGAWKIDSYDPTRGAELSANPHWWRGKVPIQHITFKFFADETSEALAFRAGAIDVASNLGSPRSFAGTAGTKLITTPSFNEVFMAMNTGAGGPWGDVHVRRAIAYAIDRTALINAAGATGYASPVTTTVILPLQLRSVGSKAQIDALIKSLPQYPTSLAKAKAEMAKSAYPHGFSSDIVTDAFWNIPQVAEALAAEVKPLGINITVSTPTEGAYFGAVVGPAAKRPFNLGGWGALGPDASGWDVLFLSWGVKDGQENFANYVRPQVDALIKQEESLLDPAKRLPIFKKLLAIYANDVPYLSLYSPDVAAALDGKFTWPTFNALTAFTGTWPLELKAK